MKNTDLAYMAGILDGEGCILIQKKRPTGGKHSKYTLSVTVGSTDEWLCWYFQMVWGGSVYQVGRTSKDSWKWQPLWQWYLGAHASVVMLDALMPYLKLKKPQAELAIQFQCRKHHRGVGVWRTDAEMAIEEAEYLLMQNMKRAHNL